MLHRNVNKVIVIEGIRKLFQVPLQWGRFSWNQREKPEREKKNFYKKGELGVGGTTTRRPLCMTRDHHPGSWINHTQSSGRINICVSSPLKPKPSCQRLALTRLTTSFACRLHADKSRTQIWQPYPQSTEHFSPAR